MKLPTEQQCLDYFKEYNVPLNILQHCLSVRNVAVFLANQLITAGITVNMEFVSRLALLHDLFKVVTIESLAPNPHYDYNYSEEEINSWRELRQKYFGMHECEVAHLFFKDKFPELAQSLKNVSSAAEKSIEEKIVHYADWRTLNNKVVSLQERLSDLQKRYNEQDDFWQKGIEIVTRAESVLFTNLNFPAHELQQRFNKEK